MSEFEKRQRTEYQIMRKKRISLFLIFVLVASVLTSIFSIIFVKKDADTYVFFQEEGTALYHAYLSENEYYEEDRLNGEHAYVASLIDHMDVEFFYQMRMDAEDVTYKHQHRVDVQLVIMDPKSGAPIYNPVETVVGPTKSTSAGSLLKISPTIDIDYQKYNNKVKEFIEKNSLADVTTYLNVIMYVDVVGMSESFSADSEGQSTVQVKIPLNQTVIKPNATSSVPAGSQRILANPIENAVAFKVLAIIFGVLDALMIVFTAVYTIKTRDAHIDYTRKVQKLLASYKPFIQKINSPFNSEGYQRLEVDTFKEMLEIRDTLQMPILMHENEDKTCSQFMIPADTRLLYVFEIKVDNYDELYGGEAVACESSEGMIVSVGETMEETVEPAVKTIASDSEHRA